MVPSFSVSEFVAVINQTLELAFNSVNINGELANFHVSKGKWVYFDLKDDEASVKFFGTVYSLPGPLKDGMVVRVFGTPRLHPRYGFSVNFISVSLTGEGSLKKAADLLEAKLAREGLFDADRKRPLPYPPNCVGLVTSGESAGLNDFLKILNNRWGGIKIMLADVQVQGESAPPQIVEAVESFNGMIDLLQGGRPDVIVVTRGGGSAEDLAAFNNERVIRAIAASRIPTLVAIGHEIDTSLAEMAADKRASTPSNAAEILVPDRREALKTLEDRAGLLDELTGRRLFDAHKGLSLARDRLTDLVIVRLKSIAASLSSRQSLLTALDPALPIKRGYAIVRANGRVVRRGRDTAKGAIVSIEVSDADIGAQVKSIYAK